MPKQHKPSSSTSSSSTPLRPGSNKSTNKDASSIQTAPPDNYSQAGPTKSNNKGTPAEEGGQQDNSISTAQSNQNTNKMAPVTQGSSGDDVGNLNISCSAKTGSTIISPGTVDLDSDDEDHTSDLQKITQALTEVADTLKKSGHANAGAYSDIFNKLKDHNITESSNPYLVGKWDEVIEASGIYGQRLTIIKGLVNQIHSKLASLKKEGAVIVNELAPSQHQADSCGTCGNCRNLLLNQYNLTKRLSKELHDSILLQQQQYRPTFSYGRRPFNRGGQQGRHRGRSASRSGGGSDGSSSARRSQDSKQHSAPKIKKFK